MIAFPNKRFPTLPVSLSSQIYLVGNLPNGMIASKTLSLFPKRFYVDVCEDNKHRFIRLVEPSANHTPRIPMSMSVAQDMQEKITAIIEKLETLGPHDPKSPREGRILTDKISRESRTFYLDLKENRKGRFLMITLVHIGSRVQIIVPVQLLNELRDTLEEYTTKYKSEDDAELPAPKLLHIGAKRLYIDVASNNRGAYLRMSEVREGDRTCITIPQSYSKQFRDIINQLALQLASENLDTKVPESGDGNE